MELVFVNEPVPGSNDAIHWCCHPCGEDGTKSTLQYYCRRTDNDGILNEVFGCRNCDGEFHFPAGVVPGDENALVDPALLDDDVPF